MPGDPVVLVLPVTYNPLARAGDKNQAKSSASVDGTAGGITAIWP